MPQVRKQTQRGRPKPLGILGRLASAWDLTETFSMLLYGRSGTGKTTFAGTFPGPMLWIVCSGGKNPGELRSINTPAMRKKITAVVVQSSDDVRELITLDGFATKVIDHATGLQDLKLKEILGIDELPAQLSWGQASQQQYGQLALQMKEIFRAFLSQDCYRVIVAQEREYGSEGDGELIKPHVHAAMTPSVAGWLEPACDYVCQTFIQPCVEKTTVKVGKKTTVQKRRGEGVEFCLRTAPHDVYASKFRVPRGTELPPCLVNPTFDKVRKMTEGG